MGSWRRGRSVEGRSPITGADFVFPPERADNTMAELSAVAARPTPPTVNDPQERPAGRGQYDARDHDRKNEPRGRGRGSCG